MHDFEDASCATAERGAYLGRAASGVALVGGVIGVAIMSVSVAFSSPDRARVRAEIVRR